MMSRRERKVRCIFPVKNGALFIVLGEGHGRVPWAHWPPVSRVKRRKERGSWRWLVCWSTE
jgi:hypothetical protein